MLEYVLQVAKEEADLIGFALGKLPMEQSLGLFTKLRLQVQMQEKAAQATRDAAAQAAALLAAQQADSGAGAQLAATDTAAVEPAPDKKRIRK